MKKSIRPIMCLALLLPVCGLRAQTAQPCVVVEQTDGSKAEYLLADSPRVSCANQVVTLTTARLTVEMAADEVAKIYLSQTDMTGVQPVGQPVRYRVTTEGISIGGLAPGMTVALYDASGRRLASKRADAHGSAVVHTPSGRHQVLVVKAGPTAFKVRFAK